MASDDHTDMLMMFRNLKKQPMDAECSTDFRPDSFEQGDLLAKDFEPGKFFEIDDVNLGFRWHEAALKPGARDSAIEMGEISISRQIDRASPKLMECCFNCIPLDSAAIIKRRGSGKGVAREEGVTGEVYLRIDFTGVLIKGVSWSDDHVVKETVTFLCRKILFQYRQQLDTGRHSPPLNAEHERFT